LKTFPNLTIQEQL